MRIQPPEIESPKKKPFENDQLDRKKSAEVLTSLIQGIEGPCVLSVDAPWGAGKTTFLRMWAQHLREEFPVVEFNAWNTDFTDIPFVALSAELTDSLHEEYKKVDLPIRSINSISKEAAKILPGMIPAVAQIVIGKIPCVGPSIEKIIEQVQNTYAKKKLSKYLEERGAVKDFRTALKDASKALSEKYEGQPLVVMIDELDRCRPTYAVEFLETAKHLFAVDNIVFVLAVNREQMAYSVQALYGNDFDAQKYLHRFFDLDFKLPAPDRSVFIHASLNAINIDNYFQRTKDKDSKQDREFVEKWLRAFFQEYDVSLRDIQQAIHRIGLVLYSLPDKYLTFTVGTIAALILRTINPALYYQFIRNEVSDEKVINSVFNRGRPQSVDTHVSDDGVINSVFNPRLKSLKQEHEGRLFEAAIIWGAQEMQNISWYEIGPENSSLWRQYLILAQDGVKSNETSDEKKHAFEVIQILEAWQKTLLEEKRTGFKYAVERIELFSPELTDQQNTDQS